MFIIISLIGILCSACFTASIIKIAFISIIRTEKELKEKKGGEKLEYALALIKDELPTPLKAFTTRKVLVIVIEKVFSYIKQSFEKGGE